LIKFVFLDPRAYLSCIKRSYPGPRLLHFSGTIRSRSSYVGVYSPTTTRDFCCKGSSLGLHAAINAIFLLLQLPRRVLVRYLQEISVTTCHMLQILLPVDAVRISYCDTK
jgi:hypothetical protein